MPSRDTTLVTDHELMEGIARGDLEAFGEIVRRYQRFAWSVASRLLNDRMEAEDVTQEAFLRLLGAASRYRPQARFRTYFCRILTRLCMDRLNKKHSTLVSTVPDMADPSCGPAEKLIREEGRLRLHEALNSLPAKQKMALILKHFEGFSYSEIADTMGTTAKAVECLIARARTTLRSILSHPE